MDIVFHSSQFILAEFSFAIALGAALGAWFSHFAFLPGRADSPVLLVPSAYFLCLAINYVPLLLYAIAIAHRNSARDEVAAELAEKDTYARRYAVHQLLLLVPLVMPVLAVVQELLGRTRPAQIIRQLRWLIGNR